MNSGNSLMDHHFRTSNYRAGCSAEIDHPPVVAKRLPIAVGNNSPVTTALIASATPMKSLSVIGTAPVAYAASVTERDLQGDVPGGRGVAAPGGGSRRGTGQADGP